MSWILNSRTHTAILHIKYATLLKTDLWCYDRVFQCPLSTWFSWCSVLLQKFPGSGQSTAGHDVPQSRIEGRYSIRRRARNSSSLNQSSLYWRSLKHQSESHRYLHLPNATDPGFWFLLGTIITLAKSLSQWPQIASKHERHSCNSSVSKRLGSY